MTMHLNFLEISPLVRGFSKMHIHALTIYAEVRNYEDQELVVEEGTKSDCLYVLIEGTLTVEKHSASKTVTLHVIDEPGDTVGEMPIIDIQTHSADVRSQGNTKLVAFTKKDLVSFFEAYPDAFQYIVLNLTRILSLRLRKASEQIVRLTRPIETEIG